MQDSEASAQHTEHRPEVPVPTEYRGDMPHGDGLREIGALFLRMKHALWPPLRAHFASGDPTFAGAFVPALVLVALLFTRSPLANCIFDEQEAILANPYVNGQSLGWFDAFRRDFWGLPPSRSIGSYRPLPNLIWRALWPLGNSPWLLHWVNVVVHAAVAALIASFVWAATKRRHAAWLSGAAYGCLALLTEAVSGVVGLADVLAALFLLLSLHALRKSWYLMVPLVFLATLAGLFSKESALVAVPLVAASAFYLSRPFHSSRPLTWLRTAFAFLAAVGALVLYTELRKRWFPVESTTELTLVVPEHASAPVVAFQKFLQWFRQPRLPADPMNNPLAAADTAHRIAGALRIYASGLLQLFFPLRLSGDYSFPAETPPLTLVFPASVAGATLLVVPPAASLLGLFGVIAAGVRSKDSCEYPTTRLVLLGLLWVPLAYFPHSNIPTVLPTVRAERFWVLPAIGVVFALGPAFSWLLHAGDKRVRRISGWAVFAFFAFQCVQARRHALDYTDDLAFWGATAKAVPNSAKARLNHGVMLGARQRLGERLHEGAAAIALAPNWPMAHVYQGDTLCRLDRVHEAWPHYVRGFELGPSEQHLIALGLQCLWDHKSIEPHRDELLALGAKYPGSWLAYLAYDILDHGEEHSGVDPKYRPRGYNEGPKKP